MKLHKIKNALLCLGLTAGLTSTHSFAAPISGSFDGFPMPTAKDVKSMIDKKYIKEDEKLELMYFLSDLQVLPEHNNPTSTTEDYLNDPTKIKKYNLMPRFSPVQTGKAASIKTASSAMTVIEAADELQSSITNGLVTMITQTRKLLDSTTSKLHLAEQCATSPGNSSLCKSITPGNKLNLSNLNEIQLEKLISVLKTQESDLKNKLVEIENSIANNTPSFGIETTKYLANQVRLKYSSLGYKATQAELDLLDSNDYKDIFSGLASMNANVKSLGVFGLLGVTYRSGFTEKELRFLNAFRAVRSDIKVRPISGVSTRVLPTESSIYKGSATDVGTGITREFSVSPIASEAAVSSVTTILGANIGTDGVCGGPQSCSVSLEYTYHGAKSAKATRFGAELPGIILVSDIKFAVPEFHGKLDCTITLGWKAHGSSGVSASRGGIFRKSSMHVYNTVKYDAINDNKCTKELIKGDKNAADWHLLDQIYKDLNSFYSDNMTPSNDDMKAYRNIVEANLQAQQNSAAAMTKTRFGSYGIFTWRSVFGGAWYTPVANFITFGFGGGGYRYSRYENTSFLNNFKINQEIKIGPDVVETKRIPFDTNLLLCWKITENNTTQLEACDVEDITDATNDVNQVIENCEDEWGVTVESEDCTTVGEDDASPNDNDGDGTQDDPTDDDDDDDDIVVPPSDGWDIDEY